MNDLLLNIGQQSAFQDVIIWGLLIASLVVMVALVFVQRRHHRLLKDELAELDKIQKHNVEYEFVLKAMNLSVWHIDPKTRGLTYDQDFSTQGGDFIALPDGASWQDGVELLDPRDEKRVAASLARICEGSTNDYHEIYRVMTPYSHKKFYWEESFATVTDRDVEGKPTKVVGTTMRIDDRKEMEEALIQARKRAEESDRLKSAFIANMSHEIRTPLNAIVGFTSVLPDVGTEEERKGLIDLINENTQKLLRIIDDVVNISKVDSGEKELVLSAFDLNALLTEQIGLHVSQINMGVLLDSKFACEQLIMTTDRNKLIEVVSHLLSNAAKFTLEGNIIVGYDQPEGGKVRIWVNDTGKGISEENLEHIFERFFKVDEFIPGAGLGLSVCRSMVESLGGDITVESTLGEGSTFAFEIPVELSSHL